MDYYRLQNIQADTKMRENIAEPPIKPKEKPEEDKGKK
jgi:uncharacterized protein YqfA (UPF0365 family)